MVDDVDEIIEASSIVASFFRMWHFRYTAMEIELRGYSDS